MGPTRRSPPAEPFLFGDEDRQCFAWLHRAETSSSVGVVVCNPFGYEAVCAHRSLRHFAVSFAAVGVPALRFDYPGTGDSVGTDHDSDRVKAWTESVVAAAAELRRLTGVERVYVAGVRLGVAIAALASALPNAGIAGLIAVAPVVSGRAYVRELGMLQKALGLADPPAEAAALGEGNQEALGFLLNAQTRSELSQIDLAKLAIPASFEVLVIDRDDLPTADKWIKSLETAGAKLTAKRLPGYVEMVLDPHKTVIPDAIIREATSWLESRAAGTSASPKESTPLRAESRIGNVVERPVFVDDERDVFGIVTTRAEKPSGRAIVLLNAGAVHHIGPNRLHVVLARRWAALGDTVLRVDLSGIGDSPTRSGEKENTVYGPQAVGDVRAAIDFVRKNHDAKKVWVVGLCSGGFHALKAASKAPSVVGYVAINPLTFIRPTGAILDPPAARVTSEAERYGRSVFQLEKWRKLLRGEVAFTALSQTLVHFALNRAKNVARDASRRVHLPWKDDIGTELDDLAKRRVAQRFLFARSDPGHRLLREQGGSVVRVLHRRGDIVIETLDGPDHTFTAVWSHEPLAVTLSSLIDSVS